jgi:hypothetical protein
MRPTTVLDQVDALPGAKAESAGSNRDVQRHSVQHRFDMRRHIIRPFHVMDPGRIFRCEPIERRDQIGLHVGIGVFLDRK